MKKLLVCTLTVFLLLTLAVTAMAAKPGDTVTVSVSVVANPNNAFSGQIGFNFDQSALEFVSAASSGGDTAMYPTSAKGYFLLQNLSGITTGTKGTITLKVKEGAAAGTYAVSAYASGFIDVDENPVSVSVAGGSVTVEATGCSHTWDDGKVTKQATCKEEGVKTYTCTSCNETRTEKISKSTKHTWGDGVITKEPTCLVDGEMTVTCTVCDKTDTTVVKAPGSHTPGENTRVDKEPTCTEPGAGSYQCAKCKEWIADGVIPPRNHDKKEVVTEPTCGKDGKKDITCTRCDYHETIVIPATGKHTYQEKITKEPTCLEKGKKTFTCSVCNDTYDEDINAKGHTPGKDLNQLDPTCTKPGYKYFTCTVCGAQVKEDSIPATGKNIYEVTEETPATCTKNGKRVSACTYGCGKTKTETLKALGHKMGEWQITKAPTCTAKGEQARVCEHGCGKTETKTINALGHKMGEWKITKAPTCTEKGEQTRVCERGCGKTETKTVNALGHDWGEWEITIPVTEDKPGEKQRVCKRCDAVETKIISNRADYTMNVCSAGIRFRDLDNPITDKWFMFTPIDLSVEGTQTFDLVAGNMHQIGKVNVQVKDGYVTVSYRVNNAQTIHVFEEYMTLIPSLSELTELDFDKLPCYAYGTPISIADTLGGDTKVLLLLRNRAMYSEGAKGVDGYDGGSKVYKEYVEQLKQIMD